MTTAEAAVCAPSARPGALRAFRAMLARDLLVTGRELWAFLAMVVVQPIFMLFIFGKVLTELGYASGTYAAVLFPGTVGLTTVLTALQTTIRPLQMEFSVTMEIEDRLLAPLPTWAVALQKTVMGVINGLIAAALMFPVGLLVLGHIPFRASGVPLLIVILVLASCVGSTLGLLLGTAVPFRYIYVLFTIALTPLLFTGAAQYPWQSLAHLRWFQVVTAFNPITYVSEGLRAAMLTGGPHMASWICVTVLSAALLALAVAGARSFRRRTIG